VGKIAPMDDLEELLPQIRDLAKQAANAIQQVATGFARPLVEEKSDGSPVTRADYASHDVIMAGLTRLTPSVPIVSEEGRLRFAAGRVPPEFWLVDPLDGTKEFIAGNTDYTVNIALVRDGDPVMGVVDLPPLDIAYFALRGRGAFRQDGERGVELVRPRRESDGLIAVASRSHLDERTQKVLDLLGVGEVVRRGSSAKMCAVAEGTADLYPRLGPTHLWDTAAGTAVAREAGCKVLAPDGEELHYDPARGMKHDGFLVYPAQRADLGERILEAVRSVG